LKDEYKRGIDTEDDWGVWIVRTLGIEVEIHNAISWWGSWAYFEWVLKDTFELTGFASEMVIMKIGMGIVKWEGIHRAWTWEIASCALFTASSNNT